MRSLGAPSHRSVRAARCRSVPSAVGSSASRYDRWLARDRRPTPAGSSRGASSLCATRLVTPRSVGATGPDDDLARGPARGPPGRRSWARPLVVVVVAVARRRRRRRARPRSSPSRGRRRIVPCSSRQLPARLRAQHRERAPPPSRPASVSRAPPLPGERPRPGRRRRHRRQCGPDDDEATAACSTGSPGPCSPPATTPTRAASADEFRDCYGRAGAATARGPGRRPATTTGRRPALAGYFGYFGDAATDRTGVVVLRTTSGPGTSSCSTRRAPRSMAAMPRRPGRAGWRPISPASRPMHARDLPPPALQLRLSTATSPTWTPFWRAAVCGRRRRHGQRPRPRLRAVRARRTPTARPDGATRASASSSSAPVDGPLRAFPRVAPNSELRGRRSPTACIELTCTTARTNGSSRAAAAPSSGDRGTASCH